MKLLLCPECSDIFNLQEHVKTCGCGHAWGQYIDELNAVYSGGIPLGFANSTFFQALEAQPKDGDGKTFTAFVIPVYCPTFKEIKDGL
jgi:hypothetical protein